MLMLRHKFYCKKMDTTIAESSRSPVVFGGHVGCSNHGPVTIASILGGSLSRLKFGVFRFHKSSLRVKIVQPASPKMSQKDRGEKKIDPNPRVAREPALNCSHPLIVILPNPSFLPEHAE